MIGYKRVARRLLVGQQLVMLEHTTVCMLTDDISYHRLHETHLEIQGRLHTHESQSQQSIAKELWQPRGKALHNEVKLAVVQQVIECLLHFLRLIRPDVIKLLYSFNHILKLIFHYIRQHICH